MKSSALRRWVESWSRRVPGGRAERRRARRVLGLESLECRVVPSGTPELLKNINAGTEASDPGQFTAVGGTIFFAASDPDHERELWKTDGTAAGTTLVKDIRPGSGGSYPEYLTSFRGLLYFVANNGTNGRELWKSDGTEAGTVLVKDIRTGSISVLSRKFGAELLRHNRCESQQFSQPANEPNFRLRTLAPIPSTSRSSEGRCSSRPATRQTARSCGRATAPKRAPSWWRTSAPAEPTPIPANWRS